MFYGKLYITKSPIIVKTKVKTIRYGVKAVQTFICIKINTNSVGNFTILLFYTKLWPGLLYKDCFSVVGLSFVYVYLTTSEIFK